MERVLSLPLKGKANVRRSFTKMMLSLSSFPHRTLMPMIIGEIKRYLRDNNAVRVSRSVRDLAYRALQAREHIARQEGREATVEDIVKNLSENGIDKTADEVTNALDAIAAPVSLYDPVYGDGDDCLYVMDQLRDDNESEENWLESIALREALKNLSEREKTILNLRFYKGRTQMEIASEIGISQAQVSRVEKGAIERIKKEM